MSDDTIAAVQDDAKKTVDAVTQDLSAGFSALKKDIASLTGLVGDLARTQADTAKSSAYGLMDKAKQTYSEQADVLTDRASDVQDRVRAAQSDIETAVEKNPLTALSLAFLSGLVIGMMSRSRH